MTELERALVALGRDLELPPTPDVAATVRGRLHGGGRRRTWLAAVALALLAALAVALAVPAARGAILRFLHIRGAEVSLVERLPETPARAGLPGVPARLDDAPFRVLLPDGREPDAVSLDGGVVWLRYGPPARPRLLVAEARTDGPVFLKQAGARGADVRSTSVAGQPALWVAGDPHALVLPGGGRRLAGNTLLWQRGDLTIRLEADVPLERARALALGFR